ncbi:MAG: glycosyltransferase family 1 protein [Candidatus Aminicenantes bacterium]|nr:MAG: glycosyltransferase family 1 protein [Candidatus Aminicenantes bacterium]
MGTNLNFSTRNFHLKNIGFISTRIAGIDGVSLEIEKWAEVLSQEGFNCFYFAGEVDRPEEISYVCAPAHFEHPEIAALNQKIFGVFHRSRETTDKIFQIKNKLKSALYKFKKKFGIDIIIPENALSIPLNIPLGIALTEFIAETQIPTIAHHHDFFWERDRFLINSCPDYIAQAFPPDLPSIQHVVINSLASRQLNYHAGVSNTVIPNVYNFEISPPHSHESCLQLKEEIGLQPDDLFILQPTRIVPRKRIERAIKIVHNLGLSRPFLIITHPSGDEGDDYYQHIMEYAQQSGVKIIRIDHVISSGKNHAQKPYTITDAYQCADLVTYPSDYEGFGNAFLEAIYFKKPIVVNRYSIYVTDIEPKGFEVISFEGFATRSVISQIKRTLSDPLYRLKMTEKNFKLGKKFFSYEILRKKLLALLSNFQP